MRPWLLIGVVGLLAASKDGRAMAVAPSPAGDAPDAAIRKTIDDAFAVLKNQSLAGKQGRGERIAELRRIADRTFDWAEMAKSSLGVRWRSLDNERRSRFIEVFKGVLAAEYMDDIDRFQGTEIVTIDGTTRAEDDVVVRSTLVTSSRDRVPIDYRMRVQQGRWMVVDLSIEGVSLVNHFRKTFAGALANISIDELIERLKRQLPAAVKPAG